MTEMRDSYFYRILAPPNAPPSPDAKILNYLNDREIGAPLSFVGFWRPPMTPPQTPQYLTILQTERGGGHTFSRILAPPQCPPSPDATILNYLNDRERGAILCRTLPPLPQTPQYLTILMTVRGGGGANIL